MQVCDWVFSFTFGVFVHKRFDDCRQSGYLELRFGPLRRLFCVKDFVAFVSYAFCGFLCKLSLQRGDLSVFFLNLER